MFYVRCASMNYVEYSIPLDYYAATPRTQFCNNKWHNLSPHHRLTSMLCSSFNHRLNYGVPQCCHLTVIWFNTVNSTQFLLKIKTWAQQSWCIANMSVLVEYEYVLVDRWYFAAISDSLNEFLITAQFYFRNATCLEGKWMCIIEGYWYNPCLSISLYNIPSPSKSITFSKYHGGCFFHWRGSAAFIYLKAKTRYLAKRKQ